MTICLLVINQAVYKLITRESDEETGERKDCIFDELYRNRIYLLNQRTDGISDIPSTQERVKRKNALYYSRAYYKVKVDKREKAEECFKYPYYHISWCENNPNNYDKDGNLVYFWVDYYDDETDNRTRNYFLEFADELPAERALELYNADVLAEYRKIEEEYERKKNVLYSWKIWKKL